MIILQSQRYMLKAQIDECQDLWNDALNLGSKRENSTKESERAITRRERERIRQNKSERLRKSKRERETEEERDDVRIEKE